MYVHGYAEILRNVLACRGIKAIYVESITKNGTKKHAFNQVRIENKWYYVDLTWDVEWINTKQRLENCLLSKKEFGDNPFHRAYETQTIYTSNESYYVKEQNGEEYQANIYYLKKLAEQGDAQAQHRLGECYYDGKGVEQSYEKAVEYFIRAANSGDELAIAKIQEMSQKHEIGNELITIINEFLEKAVSSGLIVANYIMNRPPTEKGEKGKGEYFYGGK